MRLSEVSNLDLIKEIDDDVVAREVARRFTLYESSVSEQIQKLEEKVLKLQGVAL